MKDILCYAVIVLAMLAAACQEQDAPRKMKIRGHFSIVGNAPFTRLVFKADDGRSYEVSASEKSKFSGRQGAELEIEGTVSSVEMETADQAYKRRVYTIENLVIVNELKRQP